MAFSDYSWKYCPDTIRNKGAYILFYKCVKIYHGTHVPGPVDKPNAESEYNAACTAGMALSHFNSLIHEFLNKDPDTVPDEAPLILLDTKYAVCMDTNVKDTKLTRHISRRVH